MQSRLFKEDKMRPLEHLVGKTVILENKDSPNESEVYFGRFAGYNDGVCEFRSAVRLNADSLQQVYQNNSVDGSRNIMRNYACKMEKYNIVEFQFNIEVLTSSPIKEQLHKIQFESHKGETRNLS
jgi:hypothetical protein